MRYFDSACAHSGIIASAACGRCSGSRRPAARRTPMRSSCSRIARHRGGRFGGVDGDAHHLGAGARQLLDLDRGGDRVRGIGVGHRLHDDRRAAADDATPPDARRRARDAARSSRAPARPSTFAGRQLGAAPPGASARWSGTAAAHVSDQPRDVLSRVRSEVDGLAAGSERRDLQHCPGRSRTGASLVPLDGIRDCDSTRRALAVAYLGPRGAA